MPNDDLLARLGQVARDLEREDDPALQKLVEGTLTPGELAELEQRAASDGALAEQVALLRPVDDAVRRRIVERARFELPARGERKSRARWLVPASALVAAAAWLLLLRAPEIAPLPGYGLRASGGIDQVRGEQVRDVLELAPDALLDVLLRPAQNVRGPLAARVMLSAGSRLELLGAQPAVSAQGAVRLRGSARALFGPRAGDAQLFLVACRPEACDTAVVALRSTHERRGDGWHAESVKLHFTP